MGDLPPSCKRKITVHSRDTYEHKVLLSDHVSTKTNHYHNATSSLYMSQTHTQVTGLFPSRLLT